MKTIKIIPLATPKTISDTALEALKTADKLYVQTLKHPCAEIVNRLRPDAIPMDDIYDSSEDFDELNRRIAERLTSGESCAYAVLNRGVSRELYDAVKKLRTERGFSVAGIPSTGFAEAALSAALEKGFDINMTEYRITSAMNLRLNDTDNELVIEEIDSLYSAGDVKLKLSEFYPDEHIILLCSMNDDGSYNAEELPLYKLDSFENEPKLGASSVVIVPECGLMERTTHGLDGLMEVMYRLRAPGGCPWDAEQTHESLRSSLIEESYEVLDAINRNDLTALEEELGDLLLQVVFHAVIEEERAEFTMRDVITGIVNKLIYRHPHVFGDVNVKSSDEVLVNWENLKQQEKHQQTVADAMRSVPASFPALMRSYKVQKKAAHVGFDFDSAASALPKVHEEADEVLDAIGKHDEAHLREEVGDLLFACVNASRLLKIDPELALSEATDKFMNRFIETEKLMLSENKHFEGMTLEDMDSYWDRVKAGERAKAK